MTASRQSCTLRAALPSAQVFVALFAGLLFLNTPAHSEVSVCSETAVCQWGTMKGEPPRPDSPYMHILITGTITSKDVDAVQRATSKLSATAKARIVILSSLGGEVEAAMAIGQIVRNKLFWTTVDSGSKCASSCVLILAAGVGRSADEGSVVAIHRPTFPPKYFAGLSADDARSKYVQMTQKVRSYLSEMGMSDRLFEQMMSVGSYDVKALSIQEMIDLGLSGFDPAYEERQHAEDTVQFGPDYMKRVDEYGKRMRSYAERCMALGKTQWTCMFEYKKIEPWPSSSKPAETPDFSSFGVPASGAKPAGQ
jgi:hypothetical protein